MYIDWTWMTLTGTWLTKMILNLPPWRLNRHHWHWPSWSLTKSFYFWPLLLQYTKLTFQNHSHRILTNCENLQKTSNNKRKHGQQYFYINLHPPNKSFKQHLFAATSTKIKLRDNFLTAGPSIHLTPFPTSLKGVPSPLNTLQRRC